jgi:biopolymer transport protein ExbD
MTMSMGQTDFDSDDAMMNDINMTPLIDVMLVLLIIFIVTLPVIHGAVNVALPQAASKPPEQLSQPIEISVDASGSIYWNKTPVSDEVLKQHIAQTALANPADQPVVQIYADKSVRYERVALILSDTQAAGLGKIDFMTDSPTRTH